MDERITYFIQTLREQLEHLPEEETRNAVGFYEEYLNEAAEEGKDLDSVLQELGSPERIAGVIITETSINRAANNPGVRNFTRALKSAFRSVSAPLSVFLLSVVALFSFSMVAVLFGGAFAAALGAMVAGFVMVYEAIRIPLQFVLEKLGALGFALFSAGICMLLALLLYRCGRMFITLSAKLIRLILRRPGESELQPAGQEAVKKPGLKRVITILLAVSISGMVLFLVSGLSWRYFVVTNSMKPDGMMKKVVSEYEPSRISGISVTTTNSVIRVVRGPSDKVIITYEQPDWLDYELDAGGGVLSFREKSNGRLPLYSLLSLHEGLTEVEISLPQGFNPYSLTIKSTGGHIFIQSYTENIEASTMNGSIRFAPGNEPADYDLKAKTKKGVILVGGVQTGTKAYDGYEYYRNAQSGKTVSLRSSSGNIAIE